MTYQRTPGIYAVRQTPDPVDYGLVAYPFPPETASGTSSPLTPAGTIFGSRLYLSQSATITNIELPILTAGNTLTATQCLAGLYYNNTLLSATADQAAAWVSTGLKTMALTSVQTNAPVGYYDVVFFYNGTTGPAPYRGNNPAAMPINGKLSTTAIKYFTADTGRTTSLPATLGSKTAQSISYWVGLS